MDQKDNHLDDTLETTMLEETIVEPVDKPEISDNKPQGNKPKFPNIMDLLALLGVFFVMNVVAAFLSNIIVPNAEENMGKMLFFAYLISFGGTLLFAVPYSYFRSDKQIKPIRLSLKGLNMATILWGFILMFSLGVVLEPLTNSFDSSYLAQLNNIMASGNWMLVSAVVLAPILEEMLFRGVVQGSVTKRFGPVVGIIVSALVFGIVHINPIQVVGAFSIGLVLGYIYHRTKTLWSVIILHFLNNAFSYFMWMIGGQQIITMREIFTSDKVYNVVYIAAAAVSLVSFVLLFTVLSRKPKTEQEPKQELDNKAV